MYPKPCKAHARELALGADPMFRVVLDNAPVTARPVEVRAIAVFAPPVPYRHVHVPVLPAPRWSKNIPGEPVPSVKTALLLPLPPLR